MSKIPKVIPRRPLDDDNPNGYLESDNDWIRNNHEAVIWFLENAVKLRINNKKKLKKSIDFR